MRSALRSRRVAALAGLFLILVAAGCRRSPEVERDRRVTRGNAFLEKRDYARAILEFKNALRATPNDADVYYRLGLASVGAKDWNMAAASLQKALSINPGHREAKLRLAQLLANTSDEGQIQDAEQRLKELVKGGKPDAEVLSTLAFTQLRLGDKEGAVENFQQALAQSPALLNAAVYLALAKLQQDDVKGAEEVLKKTCADNPKSPDAARLLGQFYADQRRPAEAEAQFRHALELDARNGLALASLAMLQMNQGKMREADESFRRLAAFPETDYRPVHALFLFQTGRLEEAVREFEKQFRENPGNRAARTRLIAAYRAMNRAQDARRILDAAIQKNSKDLDALLQRSELCIGDGSFTSADNDLAQVTHLRPDAPEAHYLLAKLNEARGNGLVYRQELAEALRLNPAMLGVRLELARDLVAGGHAKEALSMLNEAQERQKGSPAVLAARNWALWASGDMAEMRRGIDLGLSIQKSAEFLIQDGLWKVRSGQAAAGRAVLEEALTHSPGDLRVLEGLKQSYTVLKQSAEGARRLKEHASTQPKSAAVQEFTGRALLEQGDRAGARAAFEAAKLADKGYLKADLSLAQVDVLEGKWEDARKRLERVVSVSGNSTARLWLGNVLERQGNHAAAIEQYRKVAGAGTTDPQVYNNLAYLLAENGGQADEALKHAQKAVELAPDNPAYCDTLGWILYRKGLYAGAVNYLERAAAHKTNPVWGYHLAMAYAKAGNPARGRTVLEAALRANPNVPEAREAREVVGQRAGEQR